MATLEPPSRSYLTVDGVAIVDSASTSITNFEMAEAGNSGARIVEGRLASREPTQEELGSEAREKADVSGVPGVVPGEPLVPQTPQVYITFLLISGKRRTMTFEPGTTLGRVKELVWNSWPSEWEEERPTAPSFLRVLYLGRMLQDDETLSQLNFPTHTPQSTPPPIPTIVHLSIRPFAPQGDTELKKKRNRNRPNDGEMSSPHLDLDVQADSNSQAPPPPAAAPESEETGSAGCCGCVIC